MKFRYQRRYQGKLQAVIFDWAGTVLDYGCLAPVKAFVTLFAAEGVEISLAEARLPMGSEKRDHIAQILAMSSVQQRWQALKGAEPTEVDIDRLYAAFIPLQLNVLAEHAQMIPGALDVMEACRQDGMKIGATTGYNQAMTDINLAESKKQGYEPDVSVCADDVQRGRPYPDMCLLNAIHLGVDTIHACVNVDDTVPGIESGLNAGMWTIGVAICGNGMGLSLAEVEALAPDEYEQRRERAYQRLYQSGAHYVVDSVADIMPCLDSIQARLGRGEVP